MTLPDGFRLSDHWIPCRDLWPLRKVRYAAMLAYKRLEDEGSIRIRYPVTIKRGWVIIVYDAQMPHGWALDELRKAEWSIATEQTSLLEHDVKGA